MLKKNCTSIFVFAMLICTSYLNAQTGITPEKKVDFLEKIYFSGQNKEGLNGLILATLQTMADSTVTPRTKAVLDQYAFLNGIQPQAEQADDACAIEGLLAAGIFQIDANEAMAQNVHVPTAKNKQDAGNALVNLNNANASMQNTSNNLNSAALQQTLTTGKSGITGKAASKTTALSNDLNSATTLANTGQQLAGVGKSLFAGNKTKDKPCSDVKHKDIQVGPHVLSQIQTQTTTIVKSVDTVAVSAKKTTNLTIQNADYGKVKALSDALAAKGTVSNKSIANGVGHITLKHDGGTDTIADFINDKLADKFTITSSDDGSISVTAK